MAIGDQVGKQAVEAAGSILSVQLPQLEAFLDSQRAKLTDTANGICDRLRDTMLTVVGDGLKALTAERTEAVAQIENAVHGILDRLIVNIAVGPRK